MCSRLKLAAICQGLFSYGFLDWARESPSTFAIFPMTPAMCIPPVLEMGSEWKLLLPLWLYCLIKKQGQQIRCSYRKARAAISTVAVRAMRIRRKNWGLFPFLLCFWLSFWLSLPTPSVDPSSFPIMWDRRKLSGWSSPLLVFSYDAWLKSIIVFTDMREHHGFSEAIQAISFFCWLGLTTLQFQRPCFPLM